MSVAKRIVARLPPDLRRRARAGKRWSRRMRYRVREAARPTRVQRTDIAEALREAGLERGDAVFFQSAMSPFGEFVGGSGAVLDALEDVLGPDALIAMPAFPTVGTAVEYLSGAPVFDVRSTPSTMGSIAERFRRRPGTVRSLHPTHSVAASGPGAEVLVEGHGDAPTPFGAGTPFARLIERDAWQVWFGCGVGAFTTYHAFECLRVSFPIPVFADRAFSVRCVDAGGAPRIVETLVHDPAVSAHRIDANPKIAASWRALLLERQVVTSVRLGHGEILAVRLGVLMTELERLLSEGITIYDLPIAATTNKPE